MNIVFYIAAVVAVLATLRVVTHKNAVHALLYMVTSLLAIAVIFFVLGAPFLAALEVIIYAGAIMVLFVFVAMMLNLGRKATNKQEKDWLSPLTWLGPGILCAVLLIEFIYIIKASPETAIALNPVSPKEVGTALYTKYVLGVELTAMLLMTATIGAYHVGKQKRKVYHRFLKNEND